MSHTVAALYKFTPLPDAAALQPWLKAMGEQLGVRGTLLLAREGINGTIAGSEGAVRHMLDYLRADPRLADLDVKFSRSDDMPFLRYKVRLKKEIVTLGVDGTDPNRIVGTYVAPSDWNDVIADPDTVLIDTRNRYEIEVGTFEGAVDPKTDSFREFPEWVERNRDRLDGKRVAMFCTGGIRCEKASSYMKSQGFPDVLHLKGGILKYLETQPEETSRWTGDCFVFDQRVAVGHGLRETDWEQCFACRMPLSPDDLRADSYVKGVSCPHCVDDRTDRRRFEERQRQIELAAARDEVHLGQRA
ncbi:rhodanese-related sulfurtransferase [uncultured Algimonas sp.]|uniref:oxygen-dependent tRNA uridine(34) hydroxylase TrhO n=1 Tax=uncultured Algimonas sp. TaxID=1547920 RepID=UPI002633F0A3|nr:rhodanese-related sulfurtransferase [uncultured Algimonas sp.]